MPAVEDDSSVVFCAISSVSGLDFLGFLSTELILGFDSILLYSDVDMDFNLCHRYEVYFERAGFQDHLLPPGGLDFTSDFNRNGFILAVPSGCQVIWSFLRTNQDILCCSCHTTTSLKTAVVRILPNYVATYVPIATVMIANPCLYHKSSRDMEQIITSASGQFTSREREILDAIKVKFSVINFVFYLCWIPNLLNGILLWTLWFQLPAEWIIAIWYIMVKRFDLSRLSIYVAVRH